VAEIGASMGLKTPVNQVFNDVLLKLANGEINRAAYEGNPQRLLADVQTLE
jgi:hypothetical protein